MANRVVFRGNAGELVRFLGRLPEVMAGRQQDVLGIVQGVKLRVGVACLSQVKQDFVRKSRGQVGKDGIKWAPLKPETIARRRTTRQERKELGIRSKGLRRSLSADEDREWQRLFAFHLRIGLRDLPPAAAKARAGAIAWARLKEQGAQTLLQKLGFRQVDILRDTWALLRSLEPGVEDRPAFAPGQIFRTYLPGIVAVGTSEKPWHQHGDPKKGLPARPMWPEDGKIPAAWWKAINRAATRGIRLAVEKYLGAA